MENPYGWRCKVLEIDDFMVRVDRGNWTACILRLSIKGGKWRVLSKEELNKKQGDEEDG